MHLYRRRSQDISEEPRRHLAGSEDAEAGLSGVALAGVAYATLAACTLLAMIALAGTHRLTLPIYLSQPPSSDRQHSLCEEGLVTPHHHREYLVAQALSDLGLRPGEVLTQSVKGDGGSDLIRIVLVREVRDRACGSICYCFAVEPHSSSRDRAIDLSGSEAPQPSFVLYDRPTILRVVQVLIAGTLNGLHHGMR